MTQYHVKSLCEDCGHKYAVVLIPVCKMMDDPDHNICTDECQPGEEWFDPETHQKYKDETYYRCAECDSLNTEKQYE